MDLRLSDIAASRLELSSVEAATLALAAAGECDRSSAHGPARGLPDLDDILLDESSRLWFSTPGRVATDQERVKHLLALLRALLRLDQGDDARRVHVPGAFLVLLARAAGQMDLPPLAFAAFRESLVRFGSSDSTTLSAVYRRFAAEAAYPVPATGDEDAGRPFAVFRPRVRTRLAVSRTGALAASIAIAALALAWGFASKDFASKKKEATVQILHYLVPVAPLARAGDPPARAADPPSAVRQPPVSMPTVIPALLLSSDLVGADIFSPSYAQYGRELLFHAGRNQSSLMRASFDGSGRPAVATVLRDGAANFHVTQSPDGSWIAYDSDRDGTRGVYVARPDGTGSRKVSGAGYASMPRWSFDGRRLAFVKGETRRPSVWNVWIADLAAGTLARVSGHRFGQAWSTSWFPGGDRIAYSIEDTLVIADLRRGTSRVVPSPRRGRLIRTPAVSPDGRWIVFQVHRDGGWLYDVSTGRMRRVLDDPTAEEFAWSPDSRRVIYHARRRGAWSLWQAALDPPA